MRRRSGSRSRLDGLTNLEARAECAHYRVGAFAENCGVCPRQLQRFILLRFGMPPHIWLAHMRLARAITCLKHAGLVKEAAAQAGYDYSASFDRWFKKQNGLPPSAFRHLRLAKRRRPRPQKVPPSVRYG